MSKYSSFDEINQDLKVLKLQNQIDMEQLKLDFKDTKSSFSPLSVIGNTAGAIIKKALVVKTVNKLFGLKKVKVKNMEDK
ncbi:MAG: DUF6327 family protein [Leeuwenhoekiella sp.]